MVRRKTSKTMDDVRVASQPAVPPATLRLKIDREALASNWTALDQLSGKAKAGAAVKANAYGLGIDQVVPTLLKAGAQEFFVAHWGEVPAVATHCDAAQISVLHGPANADEARFARAIGAVPVLNSLRQISLWQESGGGRCHLMVDSGINRLGLSIDEVGDPVMAGLDADILMSHLASADEDRPQNAVQQKAFMQVCETVPHRRASLANSAGIALGVDYHFDLTRPGLALYGGVPREELTDCIHQVAFPQAAILQTRMLKAGDKVGYNGTFTAYADMRVGVVSLGYADGFLRQWSDENPFSHHGRNLPLLGKISMDMVVVDLTGAPDLAEGDWIDLSYHLPDAARRSGLSQYELLTVLGQRFSREC